MNWFRKIFKPWPKVIKITVRDGNCDFLDSCFVSINSWNEIMSQGEQFAQDVMQTLPNELVDEVYWSYEEV